MSIREEAQQEAERRRPDIPADLPGTPGNEARFPTGYSYALERAMFVAGAVWASDQADREPSADTGCPHEACEIDTAGNPTRCADCGDDLDSVPDWEPSDAEVEAAAHAIHDHDAESLTCYDHDGVCCPCGAHDMGRGEWQVHRARAVLLAAQEVRRGD